MNKRKAVKSPGVVILDANDSDFTLCASLYYDAVYFYSAAQKCDLNSDTIASARYKRASMLTIFSFFEALINDIAFNHAAAHKDQLPAFELDILEEKETKLNSNGTIERKGKFHSIEARFRFLVHFLSGKDFDCGGRLWNDFREAIEIRNTWAHPKPPFDTWSLSLTDVKKAIITIREMFVVLSNLMEIDTPLWLSDFETVLSNSQ